MKNIPFSFSAFLLGCITGMVVVFQSAWGSPPFSFLGAFLLAGCLVTISALGGFEWGLVCLSLQALFAYLFRDAVFSASILLGVAVVWYIGGTVLAARGSRALTGISAGVLFLGLLLERMPSFSWRMWMACIGFAFLEISGMYLIGNTLRGRWFSRYA